ncbi:unnamed protein product [Orchesella dallaii]|uniref:Uncharacterized protein n=1 Tax=Orchesella dallaii TaxID=48710 RepID=A0ABP1RY44_9HEXA
MQGWSNDSPSIIQEIDEDEDIFDDSIGGRSYAEFEKKLKHGFLDATKLGLVSVPPAIFEYKPPLQRIELRDNKIELLPDNFFDDLPMLSWCDFRYNKLQVLPTLNSQHENLTVLLLQDNQLTDLPYSLAYAVKLHTLGWTNNNIAYPPREILLAGCHATLTYLREQLVERLPVDEQGNLTSLGGDEKLKEDLAITARKTVSRSLSRTSMGSRVSGKSSVGSQNEEISQKRRIDRLKYTWGLWQDIPYDGVNNQLIFEKSMQEVKNEINSKLNRNKEAVLQKMKDTDVLGKWRWDARMLQMKGPAKPYDGVNMPFGTDADIAGLNKNANPRYNMMDPQAFQKHLSECMKKLTDFAKNPAPMNDTEKSLQRLKEVEDVQRKLMEMKLTWTVQSSNPQ